MTQATDAPGPRGGEAARRGCGPCSVMGIISVPLRFALGGLFLLAAFNKLFIDNGPQLFSESIKAFKVFDPEGQGWLIQLGTFVTPWIEVLSGIAVVIGLFTRAGAVVLGLLLTFFIALIASALVRGLNVECGCFGDLSPFCPKKLGWCNIWQDVAMLGAAVVIAATGRHVLTVEQLLTPARA